MAYPHRGSQYPMDRQQKTMIGPRSGLWALRMVGVVMLLALALARPSVAFDDPVTFDTPAQADIAELKAGRVFMEQLNVSHPGPPIPFDGIPKTVHSVSRKGVIRTSDGDLYRLAGLQCTRLLAEFFRSSNQEKDRVLIVVSNQQNNRSTLRRTPRPSYVWLTYELALSDEGKPSRRFASINDTAASSEWCKPDFRSADLMVPRYAELARWTALRRPKQRP